MGMDMGMYSYIYSAILSTNGPISSWGETAEETVAEGAITQMADKEFMNSLGVAWE